MLPSKAPNLNQILFKGYRIDEFNKPKIKKIIAVTIAQILILPLLNNGNKDMIIKNTKKTNPKFLFDEILIFFKFIDLIVNYLIKIYQFLEPLLSCKNCNFYNNNMTTQIFLFTFFNLVSPSVLCHEFYFQNQITIFHKLMFRSKSKEQGLGTIFSVLRWWWCLGLLDFGMVLVPLFRVQYGHSEKRFRGY